MNARKQAQGQVYAYSSIVFVAGKPLPPNPKGAASFDAECVRKPWKYAVFTSFSACSASKPARAEWMELIGPDPSFIHDIAGIGATALWSVAVTVVLVVVLRMFVTFRIDEDIEIEGLDVNIHGERGYIF